MPLQFMWDSSRKRAMARARQMCEVRAADYVISKERRLPAVVMAGTPAALALSE